MTRDIEFIGKSCQRQVDAVLPPHAQSGFPWDGQLVIVHGGDTWQEIALNLSIDGEAGITRVHVSADRDLPTRTVNRERRDFACTSDK